MKYIIAYDGGGTKTEISVFDKEGNLYFTKIGQGSNIYSLGDVHFVNVVKGLYNEALNFINILPTDIELIYLGLSGADLESDFIKLNEVCNDIFINVPFKIVNDAWIIMRSGLSVPYGAVAIAGTGTNSAAINKDGKKAILRSLSYILGTYGGGLDIATEALHYAFRADELTYKDTLLRTEIPKKLLKKDMNEVVDLFYPIRRLGRVELGEITGLVNECANKGDEVSIEILTCIGNVIAHQTSGVIKQVALDNEEFNIVIGGRVFSGTSKVLLEEFTRTIKSMFKNITIVVPEYRPVVGAYFLALDKLGIEQNQIIEKNITEGADNFEKRN